MFDGYLGYRHLKRKKPKASKGYRPGVKRRDMRWIDARGEVWDSKFESLVYEAARNAKQRVRRCDKAGKTDTLSYYHLVRGASCKDCSGTSVGRVRGITFDLFIDQRDSAERQQDGYYLEVKGYMRAPKRALLRSFVKERPDVSLRLILQSDFKVTKSLRFGGWVERFLPGVKYVIWSGAFPGAGDWKCGVSKDEKRTSRRAIRKVS